MRALIFDSGMGGLTVAREISKGCPGLAMDYVADDAFRPYGEKSEAQLRARLPGLLATLEIMLEPDIIVLACNTASVTALAEIRKEVKAPVVGVVPAIKPAAGLSENGIIAVLGTPRTVSQIYVDDLIRNFAPELEVRRHGSIDLVSAAENKMAGHVIDPQSLKNEIAPLFPLGRRKPDVIVMACTHFPLIQEELAEVCPAGIKFVDSGEAIARRVKSLLGDIKTGERLQEKNRAFIINRVANAKITKSRKLALKQFGFENVVRLYVDYTFSNAQRCGKRKTMRR